MGEVIAKFKCYEVAETVNGSTVRMQPVTGGSKENENFFKWTPYGNLEMGTVNPDIKFKPGKSYYVTFVEEETDN